MPTIPTVPSHVFITNGPDIDPEFTIAGHITLDSGNIDSQGSILFRALDNSWKSKGEIVDGYDLNFPDNLFTGVIAFNTVNGTPPFPATISFGPIPLETNVEIPGLDNTFIFITRTSPSPKA